MVAILEKHLKAELNDAWIEHRCDLPECVAIRPVCVDLVELRVIERVVRFGAELDSSAFSKWQGKRFEERNIPVSTSRPGYHSAALVAEG